MLAIDVQRLSTGYQDRWASCFRQRRGDVLSGRQDLLEIVEHEQELPLAEVLRQGLLDRPRGHDADAQTPGN
jgi:hypothetical protein